MITRLVFSSSFYQTGNRLVKEQHLYNATWNYRNRDIFNLYYAYLHWRWTNIHWNLHDCIILL